MVDNSELLVRLHQDRMAVQPKEQSGLVDIPHIKDMATPVVTADGIRETAVQEIAVQEIAVQEIAVQEIAVQETVIMVGVVTMDFAT